MRSSRYLSPALDLCEQSLWRNPAGRWQRQPCWPLLMSRRERLAKTMYCHIELRRDLKQTELHVPLRHSRRRPLG